MSNPFEKMIDNGYEGPVTIDTAKFGYHEETQDGEKLILIVDIHPHDPEESDIYGEQSSAGRWSLGSNWDTTDDGKTIEKLTGKDKFHPNSMLGMWTEIFAGTSPHVGTGENCTYTITEKAQSDLTAYGVRKIKKDGLPTTAAFWKGMEVEVAQVPVEYGGEIGTLSRMLPIGIVGKAKNAAKSNTKAKAEAETGDDADGTGLDPEFIAWAESVYTSLTADNEDATWDDFIQVATGDDDAEKWLVDHDNNEAHQEFLNDENGGAWDRFTG